MSESCCCPGNPDQGATSRIAGPRLPQAGTGRTLQRGRWAHIPTRSLWQLRRRRAPLGPSSAGPPAWPGSKSLRRGGGRDPRRRPGPGSVAGWGGRWVGSAAGRPHAVDPRLGRETRWTRHSPTPRLFPTASTTLRIDVRDRQAGFLLSVRARSSAPQRRDPVRHQDAGLDRTPRSGVRAVAPRSVGPLPPHSLRPPLPRPWRPPSPEAALGRSRSEDVCASCPPVRPWWGGLAGGGGRGRGPRRGPRRPGRPGRARHLLIVWCPRRAL